MRKVRASFQITGGPPASNSGPWLIALTAVPTIMATSSERLAAGQANAFRAASGHSMIGRGRCAGGGDRGTSPRVKHGLQSTHVFPQESDLLSQGLNLLRD